MRYVELQVTSNFSFRRGGSHPEELVDRAADLGYDAVAITDRNTFAGVVRAYVIAKERGIRFIPACRIDLLDGPSLLAYPTDREAYSRLSALLTRGNLRAEKEKCHIYKKDVYEFAYGSIFVIVPPERIGQDFEFELVFKNHVREYRENLQSLFIAATNYYTGDDGKRLFLLSELGVPGGNCRTSSPACAKSARSSTQDIGCIRTPNGSLSRFRKWNDFSASIRKRWRMPAISQIAARSTSGAWSTNIRASLPPTGGRRTSSLSS
jgi:error-prone DNA polymerase